MTTDGSFHVRGEGDSESSQPSIIVVGPALPPSHGPRPARRSTRGGASSGGASSGGASKESSAGSSVGIDADGEAITVVHRPSMIRAAHAVAREGEDDGWSRKPFASGHAQSPPQGPSGPASQSTALALAQPAALARRTAGSAALVRQQQSPSALARMVPGHAFGEAMLGKLPSLWRVRTLGWGAVLLLTFGMYVVWFGVPVAIQQTLGLPAGWVKSQAAPPAPEGVTAVVTAVGRPLTVAIPKRTGVLAADGVADGSQDEGNQEPELAQPTRQHVLAAVESVRPEAQECGYSGTTFVNITVEGRTGRVTNAAAERELGDVSQCIVRAVRRADFPRFRQREFRIKLMLRL